MNWLLFVLGVPVGALLFRVAEKLERRYKGKSETVRGLLLGLPISIFALLVILFDVLL